MKIFVMGLTASGKSSQAKRIANFFGLNHYCGSAQLLNKLNREDSNEDHWWFSEVGDIVEKERDGSNVDQQVDEFLLNIAKKENTYVIESWTTPFLYKGADTIKIYLAPSLHSRAEMAINSKKDKSLSIDELRNGINLKDTNSRNRFKQLYGIDVFDTSEFDIVLDNSILTPEQTGLILSQYIIFSQTKVTCDSWRTKKAVRSNQCR